MFTGHLAVGLAAKRVAPEVSLGPLIVAPIFLDVLWPFFLLAGVETVRIDPGNTAFTPLDLHDFPYSHSLVMALVWSLVVGLGWLAARRDRRGAVVLGLAVFSHWILDWVTHRPDLPLWPGSATHVGLGLWNSVPGTMIVEGAITFAGIAVYATCTRAVDRIGAIAWWAYAALIALFFVLNAFSPPPSTVGSIIAMAIVLEAVLIGWAWWLDAHREPIR